MTTLEASTARGVAPGGRDWWTDGRLNRLTIAILFGLILGITIGVGQDSTHRSALMAGDFPGFYSPAVIVHEGRIDRLYDIDEHHRIQQQAWPAFGSNMYISVYPPYFSAVLAPLARIGPEMARLLWTALSIAAYLATLLMLRVRGPALHDHFSFVAVSSFLFTPVFFGVLGGQNTAFSLLLYVSGARLLQSQRRLNDCLAGILFGLWLFKPQFGLLAGAYLLLRGKWSAFAMFVLVAGLWWLLGAAVAGPHWLSAWAAAALQFGAINYGINDYQMTSFAGILSTISRTTPFPETWVLPSSILLSAALLGFLLGRRARSEWLLGPVLVLVSPQTLFYDLSIALVSCLRFLSFSSDRAVLLYLLSAVGLGAMFALRTEIPLALPFFAALMALHFVLRHAAVNENR